jgi:hypothetical protein
MTYRGGRLSKLRIVTVLKDQGENNIIGKKIGK